MRHFREGLRRGRSLIGVALAAMAMATASPALSDEYDPQQAGHPLRIAAYVVHPVGVTLDYLIMRPAFWIGSHEPFRTLFGRGD